MMEEDAGPHHLIIQIVEIKEIITVKKPGSISPT
jgi:hypothetical protein